MIELVLLVGGGKEVGGGGVALVLPVQLAKTTGQNLGR